MSEQTTLSQEVVAQETPQSGMTRRGFVTLSAAACGAAALLLNNAPARALGYSDAQLLRFLEEVERVELDFFTRAALSGTADGLQEREANALNLLAKQDNEHAYWFKLAREKFGLSAFDKPLEPNTPASRLAPSYKFSAESFKTRASLFSLALSLKETSVGAYYGVVARLDDPKVVQAVAALAGVEGRHLAVLRELSGQSPFVAYETSLDPSDVVGRLVKYGFSTEVF
jgi:rubrerythrin